MAEIITSGDLLQWLLINGLKIIIGAPFNDHNGTKSSRPISAGQVKVLKDN